MAPKRKRHDPRPIWAVREGEALEPHHQDQRALRPQNQPIPTPQPAPRTVDNPVAQHNGHLPPPAARRDLTPFERPISDDREVYDEVTRQVCDFIWGLVVEKPDLRRILAEDPQTQLEIEARWGHIIDRQTDARIRGIHRTESVVQVEGIKFESTMSLDQHRRMNQYLNGEVQKSRAAPGTRPIIDYKHTKEVDRFYELTQEGFVQLHPLIQQQIKQTATKQRVRVTHDLKTGEAIKKIIKLRLGNLEISSPSTEWDYRIGVNIEINFPGSLESLTPAMENGRPTTERSKDRMSYSWLSAFQIDLTQVSQGATKNHELELELDPQMLMEAADNIQKKLPDNYESLVSGMVNNLRVLSREITPMR